MGKLFFLLILLSGGCMAQTHHCNDLSGWADFKKHFISKDGRVIDPASENAYTTSEGQSYGMFFALLANDHKVFAKLLNWTQNNLARGNLGSRLPAWQWGRQKNGQWDVTDKNSASDSDLWIAYTLLEAGRLWQSDYYKKVGLAMGELILKHETAVIPKLGLTLLPGPQGFQPDKNTWRLNPSYLPIFLMRGMYYHSKDKQWLQLINSSQKVLLQSAPKGFAPDWADYYADEGFGHHGQSGSYDAIRVYMWAAMISDEDPLKKAQIEHFRPMAESLSQHPLPGESVNILTGKTKNTGSLGFSAALLPYLKASGAKDALEKQLLRLVSTPLSTVGKVYYDQVLGIFAVNWMAKHYYFDRQGLLNKGCGLFTNTPRLTYNFFSLR